VVWYGTITVPVAISGGSPMGLGVALQASAGGISVPQFVLYCILIE